LHEQSVGLVSAPGATVSASELAIHPRTAITWRPLSDASKARTAVRHGDLAAAVIVDGHSESLVLASAGGPLLTQALTKEVGAQAHAAGLPLTVSDIRPPQAGDPRGLGVFVLILGWVLGGYAGAMLIGRAMGSRLRTLRGTAAMLGWLAGYAIAAAASGVLLADSLLGLLTGHAMPLLMVGALLVFTVGVFTAAMLDLLGPLGLIVAVGSLVVVGNPVSGGLVPSSMLPAGWRFLAEILPNTAGVRLVRSAVYFDGHGISDPLIVLCSYAGVSLVALVALGLRRSKRQGSEQSAVRDAGLAEDEFESVDRTLTHAGAAV
jgi:hypothetical protein